MDESGNFGRRQSFNMSQCDPVAESTHLNGTSSSWCTLRNKYRSYTNSCVNNAQSLECNGKYVTSPKTKNVFKIDARVAADAQSKGLASRIVKYHETGSMLNRSKSAHNLYSKPGQFPAVTLKKTNLPYRATKQELSMIRIPPPEKSSFYGNTISSILRSSSVIGLQSKRTEELSRENRPIIHPPPSENDLAPTRSVLDVLKEISRKRINSDDLESEETCKKYCNRAGVDVGDTKPTNFTPPLLSSQRYKRQRDGITSNQGLQLFETQTSPEQAKKRVCNYNNDITSSLSSSVKCKRMASANNLNRSIPTNIESHEVQKSKVPGYHDLHKNINNTQVDIRFENLENALSKVDSINPITPIPTTPCEQNQTNVGIDASKPTVSDPFNKSNIQITNLAQSANNKPRLTLFNKTFDENEGAETNELLASPTEKTDDCAGIHFVKPKKITSKKCLKNPVLERTQKSKLALMLSGLRGDLYQNEDVDELDTSTENQKLQPANHIDTKTNTVTSALKSTNTVATLTTATSSNNVKPITTSDTVNAAIIVKTNSLPPTSSPEAANKTLSPLVGLKLAPPNSSPKSVVNATKCSEAQPTINLPLLSGFSLPSTNSNSSLMVTTSTNDNTIRDCKPTTAPESVIKLGPETQMTLDNKVLVNNQISSSNNLLQLPAACNSFTVLTTNTKTSSNSVSSISATKTFSHDASVKPSTTTSGTSTQVIGNSPFDSSAKLNNTFSFGIPSKPLPIATTQPLPIMFGTSKSSESLTNTFSTSVAAVTPNIQQVISTVATSVSNGTPSFAFNSTNKAVANELTTVPPKSGGVSFNIEGNSPASTTFTFGTNNFTTSSGFSFNSNPKTQNSFSNNQNNVEVANQTGSNLFSSNTSKLFSENNFNAKANGSPIAITTTVTNSSENNIFRPSSVTAPSNSKSEVLPTQALFGVNTSSNSSITTPFSFTTKSGEAPTMSTNVSAAAGGFSFSFATKSTEAPTMSTNVNAAPGGFSFSSSGSSNTEAGTFRFGSKSSGQINTTNKSFEAEATSVSQNKSFVFGSTTNRSDNCGNIFGGAVNKQSENTTPGFSFGSGTSMKTPGFSLGTSSNSSGNSVATANILPMGFAFGTSAASKPNEVATTKPFSFGSTQPVQNNQMSSVPTTNANTLNIFGVSGNSKLTSPSPFNFNCGSSTNTSSNVSASSNSFVPSSSNIASGASDRPIRRATRRLQK